MDIKRDNIQYLAFCDSNSRCFCFGYGKQRIAAATRYARGHSRLVRAGFRALRYSPYKTYLVLYNKVKTQIKIQIKKSGKGSLS